MACLSLFKVGMAWHGVAWQCMAWFVDFLSWHDMHGLVFVVVPFVFV